MTAPSSCLWSWLLSILSLVVLTTGGKPAGLMEQPFMVQLQLSSLSEQETTGPKKSNSRSSSQRLPLITSLATEVLKDLLRLSLCLSL